MIFEFKFVVINCNRAFKKPTRRIWLLIVTLEFATCIFFFPHLFVLPQESDLSTPGVIHAYCIMMFSPPGTRIFCVWAPDSAESGIVASHSKPRNTIQTNYRPSKKFNFFTHQTVNIKLILKKLCDSAL